MKNAIFCSMFLWLSVFSAWGAVYTNSPAGFSLDMPEGFAQIETENPGQVMFSEAEQGILFLSLVFEGKKFNSSDGVKEYIMNLYKAEGGTAAFSYGREKAILGDLSFNQGSFKARGYFVFIDRKELDYALICFSRENDFESRQDLMLSALDSFALRDHGPFFPGPISGFFEFTGKQQPQQFSLKLNNKNYTITADMNSIEASKVLIDREARILASFKSANIPAWYRFFRMIYRDNYHRFDAYIPLLKKAFKDFDPEERTARITGWIQNFAYNRTGTTSDFTSPLRTFCTAGGDCDSRTLLLSIILGHLEVDAVLMVSAAYGHSALGLNLKEQPLENRALFNVSGEQYLYVELTEPVDIGLIPSKVADPTKWVAFSLQKSGRTY